MNTNVTTTPHDALAELAQHDDHLVRAFAAGHPDTCLATLLMLAADGDQTVRAVAAGKLRTVSLPAERAS